MTECYRLHYAPDNASLIIRLVLEELCQPYETVLVDRATQQQRSPAYLALNPNGLIPVLETPDGVMFETGAILLWLADRHGAMAPLPDSPHRATFLKWLFFVSNTMHADLRILFYPQNYIARNHQDVLRAGMTQRLQHHLGILDAAAGRPSWHGGVIAPYIACLLRWMALYPQAYDRSWFDLATYPNLYALCARQETRPATRAAQKAEGLGPNPFTAPDYPTPPEGSPT